MRPEAEQGFGLEKENGDFLSSLPSFPYRADGLGQSYGPIPSYNTKGKVLGMTGGKTIGCRTQKGTELGVQDRQGCEVVVVIYFGVTNEQKQSCLKQQMFIVSQVPCVGNPGVGLAGTSWAEGLPSQPQAQLVEALIPSSLPWKPRGFSPTQLWAGLPLFLVTWPLPQGSAQHGSWLTTEQASEGEPQDSL